MNATKTRKPRKPAAPVSGTARWTDRNTLTIKTERTSETYTVAITAKVATLVKADGTTYAVDFAERSCSCPDATFNANRPGGCKHIRALEVSIPKRPEVKLSQSEPLTLKTTDTFAGPVNPWRFMEAAYA